MSLGLSRYLPITPPVIRFADLTGIDHDDYNSLYVSQFFPWVAFTPATNPNKSLPQQHHDPAILPNVRPQGVLTEPMSTADPLHRRHSLSYTRKPWFACDRLPARQNVVGAIDSLDPLASPVPAPHLTISSCESGRSSPASVIFPYQRQSSGGSFRSVSAPAADEAFSRRYVELAHQQFLECIPQIWSSSEGANTAKTPCPSCMRSPSIGVSRGVQCPSPPPTVSVVPASPYTPCASGSQKSPAGPSTPISVADHQEELCPPSTTLLAYLTSPVPVINKFRGPYSIPTTGYHKYYWWDIRNLREWSTFSLSTFNSIEDLTALLKTELFSQSIPPPLVEPSDLSPKSERLLINAICDVYAPRVNAALAISQGPDHLELCVAPDVNVDRSKNWGEAHLLAEYASDRESTNFGQRRARLVGVVKSSRRWNTGMRNGNINRKIKYLDGLSHLHHCMRERSCRYGFIITETELVCVRAVCDEYDNVPYFGRLELSAPISTRVSSQNAEHQDYRPTTASSRKQPSVNEIPSSSEPKAHRSEGLNAPMTVSLALYFLLMLSRSDPLPSQPPARMNVLYPGELTRQRIHPDRKDGWIPRPYDWETRRANSERGWIWPRDPWNRKKEPGMILPKVDADAGNARKKRKTSYY